MSAFSNQDFKAANYSDYRPTYNKEFIDYIFSEFKPGNQGLAIDIGCGTGQVTKELAAHFDKAIGTDLSATMIQTAKDRNKNDNVSYVTSSSEELPFIDSGSVDMVTCGQLCHWFNHKQWFEEMFRILVPNGFLIYFGYADPVFFGEPDECNELLDTITYGDAWLGKYWEQPGRNILRGLNAEVDDKLPRHKFEIIKQSKFDGSGVNESELKIERDLKFGDFMNYVTTWSSLHNYHKLNPEVVGTDDDIYKKFYKEFNTKYGWNLSKELKVVWKTCYTIARKI